MADTRRGATEFERNEKVEREPARKTTSNAWKGKVRALGSFARAYHAGQRESTKGQADHYNHIQDSADAHHAVGENCADLIRKAHHHQEDDHQSSHAKASHTHHKRDSADSCHHQRDPHSPSAKAKLIDVVAAVVEDVVAASHETSSEQWSPSLSRAQSRQRSAGYNGVEDGFGLTTNDFQGRHSGPLKFRPPTALFASQCVDSAARLPIVSTPGGLAGGRLAATFHSTKSSSKYAKSSTDFWSSGVVSLSSSFYPGGAGSSTTCVRSTNSGFWPGHSGRNKSLQNFTSLSSEVENENRRFHKSMESLNEMEKQDPPLAIHHKMQRRKSIRDSLSVVVIQDVNKESANLSSSIVELRRRHDTFVPGQEAGKGANKDDKKVHEKDEELAARLLAYRMVTKIEPELPPLTRDAATEKASPSKPSQHPDPSSDLVNRNTSQEAMDMWRPEEQRKCRAQKKERHKERMRIVAQMSEVLDETRQQELVSKEEARTKDALLAGQEQRKQLAQQWMEGIALAGFMKMAREAVAIRHMELGEMLKYVSENPPRLKRNATCCDFYHKAESLQAALDSPDVQRSFTCMGKMFVFKKAVQKKRERCHTLFDSLSGWRNAGRIFKAKLNYCRNISKIQKWWKGVCERLHEHRDNILSRWVKIEEELVVLDDAQPGAACTHHIRKTERKPTRQAKSNDRKPTHKQTCASRLLPGLRVRFIENEMRAQRFFILPQIQRWEEDRSAWKRDVELQKSRGSGRRNQTMFLWPPVRPSYMPPAHIHCEDAPCPKGCSPWCIGHHGDALILDMVKRARKDPCDWKRIDCVKKTLKKDDETDQAKQDLQKMRDNLYGPPPSTADGQRLGAVTDMPGVHIKQAMPAMHGGEAKEWLFQMASATTAEMVGVRPRTADKVCSPTSGARSRSGTEAFEQGSPTDGLRSRSGS